MQSTSNAPVLMHTSTNKYRVFPSRDTVLLLHHASMLVASKLQSYKALWYLNLFGCVLGVVVG
jgi:hypothetical protein